MAIERIIFNNLVYNENYGRKVIPFLKEEYFVDFNEKIVFNLIDSYVKKYNSFPCKETIAIDLSNESNVNEDAFNKCKQIIETIDKDSNINNDWLIDQTEKWCQEKALYNAIMKSIQVMDDKSGKLSKGSIPQILTDALGVSFDSHIGHDFIEDADSRFEFYHTIESKIPFDLEYFNKITNGGLPKKTLNIA